jgi:hypothetical protein
VAELKSDPEQPDDLAVVQRAEAIGRGLGEETTRATGHRRAGLDRSCEIVDQGQVLEQNIRGGGDAVAPLQLR